jgi:hypothetical protein
VDGVSLSSNQKITENPANGGVFLFGTIRIEDPHQPFGQLLQRRSDRYLFHVVASPLEKLARSD